jgi:hypothetical protein
MKTLAWQEVLAASGVTAQGWRSLMRRKQVALAFGAAMAPERGRFLDLDAACIRAALDFAPGLGVDVSSSLIRMYSDVVVAAIAQADAENEPVYLVAAEFMNKGRPAYNMAHGLLSEFGSFTGANAKHIPDRMVFVNATSLLARIRANAHRVGLDLSHPFFPPPGTEEYEQVMREGKADREAVMRKIRGLDKGRVRTAAWTA